MQTQAMSIFTDAIGDNGIFDPRYTCDSDNSSPELRWENVPSETKCFALIAQDLDGTSGIFTHWVIYNIPPEVHHLPAGIPPQEALPNGIKQGINSFGKLGYSGPCPPHGDRPHRYLFKIYSLNQTLSFDHRIGSQELIDAMKSSIITTAETMGRYQRAIQRAG